MSAAGSGVRAFQVESHSKPLTDASPLFGGSQSKCCTFGDKARLVAKLGAGAVALGTGASLITLGSDMFKKEHR